MNDLMLYFAYGSNMEPMRMKRRCPGAIPVGRGILRNQRLTGRLYAIQLPQRKSGYEVRMPLCWKAVDGDTRQIVKEMQARLILCGLRAK